MKSSVMDTLTFNALCADFAKIIASAELTREQGDRLIEEIRIRVRQPFDSQGDKL